MRLSVIVAMATNGVIGRDNRLPWKLPADLRRFKRLTLGHHLLMGRKTFESIGRALPGRTTVVITRNADYRAPEGVRVVGSVDAAVDAARAAGDDEAFVAGGAEIYRLVLERADRMYLTRVGAHVAGDVRFPDYDRSAWRLLSRERRGADGRHAWPFEFLVYERRS